MAKILVIDDSPTVVASLKQILGDAGHEVIHLNYFIQLTPLLLTQTPDLILLDLNMPHLSGVALGEFVRKYQQREIPILVHSSAPNSEMAEAVARLHAVGSIRKGDPVELLRRVQETLTVQKATA